MEDYLSPTEDYETRWMHLAIALVLAPVAYTLGFACGWRVMEKLW